MKRKTGIIIGLLLLLVLGLTFFTIKISKENEQVKQENTKFKEDFSKEKTALEIELEATLKDLSANQEENIAINEKFNNANSKLNDIRLQLEKAKKEVKALKNKLSSADQNNFNTLQALRAALENVKYNNKLLYKSLDSIKNVNDSLMVEVAVTKSELNTEKIQSKELASKLSDATKIQITKVEVFAVKKNKSGEFKETNRYKKADGIQVKYNVLNNKALKGVETDVLYVLKDANGLVVNPRGDFLYQGVTKKFTDGSNLVLTGEIMPVSRVVSIKEGLLDKGIYTLEVYSLDGLLAKETIELKNNVLGIF